MIRIETYRSDRHRLMLTNLLCRDRTFGDHSYHSVSDPIMSRIADKLRDNDVIVGELFGSNGCTVDDIAAGRLPADTILEINYHEFRCLEHEHLKLILENHIVMISDLMDAGIYIIDSIKELYSSFAVRKIYLTGSVYTQQLIQNLADFNIGHISLNVWPMVSVYHDKELFSCMFTPEVKRQLANRIQHNNKKFAFCPNRQPRPDRVKMLAELCHRGLLEHMDWSLGYSLDMPGFKPVLHRTVLRNCDHKMTKFLTSADLPKLLKNGEVNVDYTHAPDRAMYPVSNNYEGGVITSEYTGKYHYSVVNETCSANVITDFGGLNHITEKTYKAIMMGTMPLISAGPGIEDYLRAQGFQIPDFGYEHLTGSERVMAIADVVSERFADKIVHTAECVHNFNLLSDLEWMSDQFVKPLTDIDSMN